MPDQRVQGITVVVSEGNEPRHTRARNPAGDLHERLASEMETSQSPVERILIYFSLEYIYISTYLYQVRSRNIRG
jgi:hypothetical protein